MFYELYFGDRSLDPGEACSEVMEIIHFQMLQEKLKCEQLSKTTGFQQMSELSVSRCGPW